jgi:hypothetical protein
MVVPDIVVSGNRAAHGIDDVARAGGGEEAPPVWRDATNLGEGTYRDNALAGRLDHNQRIPLRRRNRDSAFADIRGHRTDIVAKAGGYIFRHVDEPKTLARRGAPDKRRPLAGRALVLACEPDCAVLVDGHMTDRQLVQFRRQFVAFDKIAGNAVDENQRRLHCGEVQLGAAEIGMRFDAAIGDCQRAAVAEQQQFVRPDPVSWEFVQPPEVGAGIINADHARRIVEIIFGGVKQPAISRENAMAEEVPAGDAGDGFGLAPARVVEHDREGARLAGKHHRAPRDRIICHVVAPVGQVDPVQHRSRFRQDRRAVAAVVATVGGGEHRIRLHRFGKRLAGQGCEKAGARGLQEIPPVDERRPHAQSPSSDEKPAVRPSAPASLTPKSSDRLEVTRRA